jgi:hypothetical protein
MAEDRIANVSRETKETHVSIELALDGKGEGKINTLQGPEALNQRDYLGLITTVLLLPGHLYS